MRIRGSGRLIRSIRRLKYRLRPPAIILAYHRVADLSTDPQLLSVSPQHFAEHLEVLRKDHRPMTLRNLVASCCEGNVPPRAVGITFDDGYADNLYQAKPLLAQHECSATVFVTTDYLSHQRELWWDELEKLLLTPGTLSDPINLSVNGTFFNGELGETAHYSEETYRQHRRWNVLEKNDPSPRQAHYRSLHKLVRSLCESEQQRVLNVLAASGDTTQKARLSHRMLTPDEVVGLADGGLIEVGAHTATHPSLAALPAQAQRQEIVESKTRLEEILGQKIRSFAYPYGTLSDYTMETVKLVREAGFSEACSNFEGLLVRDTDPFQLPRFLVRNWDGNEFESQLRMWFSG